MDEAIRFAELVAQSELAPKDYRGKPSNIIVAIQLGKELGVAPMQALQGIAVINGRPSVWGDLMWALVTSHPQFEDCIEEVTETEAKVTLKRRGRSPVTVTFTQADAVRAGLWAKQGPWTQYPKRQMLWRARTFAARDLFPDALKGMVSAEEATDYEGPTIEAYHASSPGPSQAKLPDELQKKKTSATATQKRAEPETDPGFVENPDSDPYDRADSFPEAQSTPVRQQQMTEPVGQSNGEIISLQQGRMWWAKAMNTHQDHRVLMAFLRERMGVSKKEEIPVTRWQEALDWAEGKAK
jgi:hypothetical protein